MSLQHAYWRLADRPAIWQGYFARDSELQFLAGAAQSLTVCCQTCIDVEDLYWKAHQDIFFAVVRLHIVGTKITRDALRAELAAADAWGDDYGLVERASISIGEYTEQVQPDAEWTHILARRIRWLASLRRQWIKAEGMAGQAWTGRLADESPNHLRLGPQSRCYHRPNAAKYGLQTVRLSATGGEL
jgi:hypothetical protein